MRNITLFDKAGVKPEAGAIMQGIRMGIMDPMSICDYAERVISEIGDNNNIFTDMLIFEGEADEAIKCMESHGFHEDERSSRCFRYVLLANLSSEGQKLLEDIEDIYASFDYPKDMEHIVYYMPSAEGDGSQGAVISKFQEFLESEKAALGF